MIRSCFRASCPNWAKTTIQQANRLHSLKHIGLSSLGSRWPIRLDEGLVGQAEDEQEISTLPVGRGISEFMIFSFGEQGQG